MNIIIKISQLALGQHLSSLKQTRNNPNSSSQVFVGSTDTSTITVQWVQQYSSNVKGYIIYYRPDSDLNLGWKEVQLDARSSQYTLQHLIAGMSLLIYNLFSLKSSKLSSQALWFTSVDLLCCQIIPEKLVLIIRNSFKCRLAFTH